MKEKKDWKEILKGLKKEEKPKQQRPDQKKNANRIYYEKRKIQKEIDKLLKKNPIKSGDIEAIFKKHKK